MPSTVRVDRDLTLAVSRQALDSMMPSVLPRFGSTRSSFASRAGPAPPSLDSQSVVEALAFSDTLQTATNLDRTSLSALMGAKWSPQLASRARCELASLFTSCSQQAPLTGLGRIALEQLLRSCLRTRTEAGRPARFSSCPSRARAGSHPTRPRSTWVVRRRRGVQDRCGHRPLRISSLLSEGEEEGPPRSEHGARGNRRLLRSRA